MKYIAAIDQGTTSTRCMLFEKAEPVVSVKQKEHQQIYPQSRLSVVAAIGFN